MQNSINEAEDLIDKLMDYYKVTTFTELANLLGIGQPAITKWKINNSINAIKKKCRELGIYNEIFGDSFNTFTQTRANSTQNNEKDVFNSSTINKKINIDSEFLPLFEALSSVAIALDKKAQLKIELTKLISDLPKLN